MSLLNKFKNATSAFGVDHSFSGTQNQQSFEENDEPDQKQAGESSNLYNSQLEKLIDLALADGELTEKEKQVLFKKAEAMGVDLDEFEMVLDARLYERNNGSSHNTNSAAPTSNKFGDIKKCPACGAMIQSFTAKCPECGYEFKNIDVNKGASHIFELLSEVKEDTGLFSMGQVNINSPMIREKSSIIKNFPVATTKDDILEFLSLAVPQARISFWSTDQEGKLLKGAWKAKCEQVIIKAKFALKDDKETLAIIANYAKELKIKF